MITPVLSADEIARIVDERDRYRAALEKILDRHQRRSESWRMPNEEQWAQHGPGSRHWSDGFITGLATVCEEARAALTPDEHFAHQEQWRAASHASEVEWFQLTGCCGRCGNLAARCDCPPSDPCACGPHELEPWPRVCSRCDGTGELPRPAWWDAEGRP